MDFAVLRQELLLDPLALGYAGMSDAAAAAKLMALDTGRTRPRTSVPVREIFGCIQDGAWPAVGSVSESKLRTILQMQDIDASNVNTRAMLGSIFPNAGGTAATRTALLAVGSETISRAAELGLGVVGPTEVNKARSGVW